MILLFAFAIAIAARGWLGSEIIHSQRRRENIKGKIRIVDIDGRLDRCKDIEILMGIIPPLAVYFRHNFHVTFALLPLRPHELRR